MLWQVVPIARPEMAAGVAARFRAQTYRDAKLCLVVNGWDPTIDVERHLKDADAWPDLVLHSKTDRAGKAIGLNLALQELKGELVAIRDDDDLQGPGDLEEAVTAYCVSGAAVVCKIPHRVLLGDELWLFAEELANRWSVFPNGVGDWRLGGSNVLFHTKLGIPFPEVRLTETKDWAKLVVKAGHQIWRTSIDNYTWTRGRCDHMWQTSWAGVRHTYGMPTHVGAPGEFVSARRARRYLKDGTFEWVDPPTIQDLLDSCADLRV